MEVGESLEVSPPSRANWNIHHNTITGCVSLGKRAMTEACRLIGPVGVLVGNIPTEQTKVAFLETDGLYFIQPGVGDDWVRH